MTSTPQVTVGTVVAAFLEQCGVKAAFGVISIHNMPILDAFALRGQTRFVMARGEAGAGNMADAYARSTSSLGVCITSTGPAAGNIAGSLIEARNAGTPLLHITGQIETQYLDQNLAYIHEAPDQLTMLTAVSKAAFRVRSAETCLSTLKAAVQAAQTAPTGPVSVEIPIDIQQSLIAMPADLSPLPVSVPVPSEAAIDALAEQLAAKRRPLLWLGGGARHAGAAVARLKALGFGIVSTVQGRGIVAEDDPASLGAYNIQKPVEAFYQRCDAMLVVGSRLRSNETLKYELKLPRPLLRIDADAAQQGRCYADDGFVWGDSALVLNGLADRLEARGWKADAELLADLRKTHDDVVASLHDGLGPYSALVQQLQKQAGRQTLALAGDGGFILNLGELATLVQEECDALIVLMNDQRYGVIQNIQDASYGGRRCYVELHTPDYAQLCASIELPHARVQDLAELPGVLDGAWSRKGPFLLEIDMRAIGGFKTNFAGPPVNKMDQVPAAPAA